MAHPSSARHEKLPPSFQKPDPGSRPVPVDRAGGSAFQILDGLTDACLVADTKGRLRYANHAARSLFRMRGRAAGRRLETVIGDKRVLEIVAAAARYGRPRVAGMLLTLSGEGTRSYELNIQPAHRAGEELLLRIALRDRGAGGGGNAGSADSVLPFDQKALADPLTIIQGYLENLLNGDIKDPGVMRQCLAAMHRQTAQILRILNTLRR